MERVTNFMYMSHLDMITMWNLKEIHATIIECQNDVTFAADWWEILLYLTGGVFPYSIGTISCQPNDGNSSPNCIFDIRRINMPIN